MPKGKAKTAQPFGEHIIELRTRMMYCVVVLLIGCLAGYGIHDRLFKILRRPLHAQLYYNTPTGGFNAIIKISIMFGVLVAVPVIIYQLGKFLSPAFKHRFKLLRIALCSAFLAIVGVLFAYYMSLPAALHFLANVSPGNLQPLITINEYLGFVFAYMTAFAILFQLPLILLFINRIKPQKPGKLMRYQRWVILISFILAAILTPTPDPINQTIMALPIILLYQFSVILIWIANRRPKFKRSEPRVEPEQPKQAKPATMPSLTSYGAPLYSTGGALPSTLPQASSISPDSSSNTYITS